MSVSISRLIGPATAVLALFILGGPVLAGPMSMIHSDGGRFVDASDRPVTLRGCNLGNWLILESWMFGGTLRLDGKPFKDQATLYDTLDRRFGRERAVALMDAFRAAYVTPRDFELIKSFGFNVVRLPFDYRGLQDDAAPGRLRPDAFHWLDHALAMAEEAGVYVILDLHGVPGGQSKQDHTGQSDQNRFWHDKALQDRMVLLWKAIAERYRGRAVVAAYDLINEPYSDFSEDVRPQLIDVCTRIAKAVRDAGDDHVLFFPGALNRGVAFYGDPRKAGLTNVGFTEHYYPGLFGSKPALETHARLLNAELPAKKARLDRLAAPYLVGEFNVVLQSQWPDALMRTYYDRYAEYGWAATMWSYKLLKNDAGTAPSAWYLVTNANALPTVDVATMTYDEIDRAFRTLATTPLAVNERLRAALTSATSPRLPLAEYPAWPTIVPAVTPKEPAGFTSLDIGRASPGHTLATGDKVKLTAGGSDIHGTHDSFRFVGKAIPADGELRATVTGFTDTNEYAKAGVMARWGDAPDAAMAMVNVFPDGTVALISRAVAGGRTVESKIDAGLAWPVQLRLDVRNGRAVASFRGDRGEWRSAGDMGVPSGRFSIGLAGCAHAEGVLTTIDVIIGAAGDAELPAGGAGVKRPAGESPLKNGSFETPAASADQAAGWNRWGDWLNVDDANASAHDGQRVIRYAHGKITRHASSGLWQDVKVEPGRRYTFTLFARHDPAETGKADAEKFELRLEGITPDGPVTLNTRDVDVRSLATGPAWRRLAVSGTAVSDTLRVLAVFHSSPDAARGGAVELDDATVTPATDRK